MPLQKEEKRSFPRLILKTPLSWQIRGVSNINNAVNGDIGLGGLGFIDGNFVAANTCLNIQLNVATRVINVTGKVANINFLPYSDKYRLGIEFIELGAQEKEFLSNYINEQMEARETSL